MQQDLILRLGLNGRFEFATTPRTLLDIQWVILQADKPCLERVEIVDLVDISNFKLLQVIGKGGFGMVGAFDTRSELYKKGTLGKNMPSSILERGIVSRKMLFSIFLGKG